MGFEKARTRQSHFAHFVGQSVLAGWYSPSSCHYARDRKVFFRIMELHMRRLVLSFAVAGTLLSSSLYAWADEPAAAVGSSAQAPALAPNPGKKPISDREQFAYSIGYLNGQGSGEQISDLDIETFIRGFRDAFGKKESLLTPQERTAAISRYKEQRLAALQADMEKLGKENAAAGAAFLEQNAKAEGVVTTASGLQYRVLKAGAGAKPKAKETIKVHYEGSFLDGTVFDSSFNRGEPATFQLDQVIPGWTEALQLFSTGSAVELFVPSRLGYGEAGAGPIPPNAVLKFKIELLGIEKAASNKAKTKPKKK
ncbi:MAG: FKBP-type peptidyl-prolyl cis-trans isomerase [Pseudomonadota bacterium]